MKTLYIEFALSGVYYFDVPPAPEYLSLGSFETSVTRYHQLGTAPTQRPLVYVEYQIVDASFDPAAVTPPSEYTFTDIGGHSHTVDADIWTAWSVQDDYVIPPILINHAPIAVHDDATVQAGQSVVVQVLNND